MIGRLIHIGRQTVRGCGTLPHCGNHPGWPVVATFAGIGGLSTLMKDGSLLGALFVTTTVGATLALIALLGAYSRANDSDRIEAASKRKAERLTPPSSPVGFEGSNNKQARKV